MHSHQRRASGGAAARAEARYHLGLVEQELNHAAAMLLPIQAHLKRDPPGSEPKRRGARHVAALAAGVRLKEGAHLLLAKSAAVVRAAAK